MRTNPPATTPAPDLIELDQRAVGRSIEIVTAITPAQLALPTPCADWSLADLLAHMIAQHHGFAAAAEGNGNDPSEWRTQPIGDDPAAAYASAAQRAIAAFAQDGVLDRDFTLPEIRDGGPFPGRMAIGFHLVDYVVHGWDVAATINASTDENDDSGHVGYAPDIVAVALAIAERVPAGDAREQPGSAFKPELPPGADQAPMARMLLLLGRSPTWPR